MPILTPASAVDPATRHRAGMRVSWKQAKQQSQNRTMVARCAEGGKEGRRERRREGGRDGEKETNQAKQTEQTRPATPIRLATQIRPALGAGQISHYNQTGRFYAEDRPILSVCGQVPPEAATLCCPPQAPTSCRGHVFVLGLY